MGRCNRDVSHKAMMPLAPLNLTVHRPRRDGAIFFLLEHLPQCSKRSRYCFPALSLFTSADLIAYIA